LGKKKKINTQVRGRKGGRILNFEGFGAKGWIGGGVELLRAEIREVFFRAGNGGRGNPIRKGKLFYYI